MSPLEIVLISVLGALIGGMIIYILAVRTNRNIKLGYFESINKKPIQGQIVFFGDSLTDFFPIHEFFPNRTMYNRGIAADTTSQLLDRIDNVIALQPKIIFLQIGTNDLGKGKSPKFIVANILKIAARLQKDIPGVKLYVLSLYPINRSRKFLSFITCMLRTNKAIVKINQRLKAACESKNVPFIDIHPLLTDAKGKFAHDYTVEGLHLSGKGYEVIASVLRPYID